MHKVQTGVFPLNLVMAESVVAEVHGIFQFTDDFILESCANHRERSEEIAPVDYKPRALYPQWYFEEPWMSEADRDTFDMHIFKFQTDSLYLSERYEECLETARTAIQRARTELRGGWRGSSIREMLEVQVHCLLKLDRLDEAVEVVHRELDAFEVADPGLCALRVNVYKRELARYRDECERWAKAYLELRPEDGVMLGILSDLNK